MSGAIHGVEPIPSIAGAGSSGSQWLDIDYRGSVSFTLKWPAGSTPTGGTLKMQSTDLKDPVAAPTLTDGSDLSPTVPIPATNGGECQIALGVAPGGKYRVVATITGGNLTSPVIHSTQKFTD